MRCELPVLLRCCFCLPLRHGLLVWSYLKQIFSLLFLTVMIMKVSTDHQRRHMDADNYVVPSLTILLTIADIVFHSLFIFSAHKKDYRKMRIFYRYSIVVICIYVVMVALIAAMCIYYAYVAPIFIIFLWYIMMPSLLMVVLMIFLQGYLILLVRSEFIKLKNNSQFEFVNHAADQKCTGNIDFVIGKAGPV